MDRIDIAKKIYSLWMVTDRDIGYSKDSMIASRYIEQNFVPIAELEKAEEKTVNELHNLHDIVLKEDVRIAKRDARVEVANILGNCLGATNLKDDYNQGWDTAVNNIKLMADKIIINNKEATNALPDK